MEFYNGKYWNVIFVKWSQEFIGDCIISSVLNKTELGDLSNDG